MLGNEVDAKYKHSFETRQKISDFKYALRIHPTQYTS